MAFAVRSLQTTGTDFLSTAGGSLSLTKPTGVVAGDLLVAVLMCLGTRTWNTTSGWVEINEVTDGESGTTISVQRRIADSSDVAASTYSFSVTGTNTNYSAVIFCISDPDATNIPGDSEVDSTTGNSASISFGADIDTTTANALVIAALACRKSSGSITLGAISLTPSASMTNALNANGALAAEVGAFRVAYTTYTNRTTVTNYASTASDTSINSTGFILAIRPFYETSATSVLATTNSLTLAQTGACDTIGGNTLADADAVTLQQTGFGVVPTTWTTNTKS